MIKIGGRKVKIFITKFTHDQKEYDGPNIHAKNIDEAEAIAESNGYIVLGELTDIIITENEKQETIH
jgi:hypothetical protein|tara:strand:+ start:285 stop:485 length:201 start_codon:yes stop_codon:yes gene_type:complete